MAERAGMRLVRAERLDVATFFDIENLHYVDADGRPVVRNVVRHPGAVVIVPVQDGQVVMIRQYRAALDRDVLELPAGKLDVEGEPAELAAARECQEEIGLRPSRLDKLVEFLNSPGFTDERTTIFVATGWEEVERTPIGPEEHAATIVEVPLDDIEAMIVGGQIDDGKSIIGLLAYLHLHERAHVQQRHPQDTG